MKCLLAVCVLFCLIGTTWSLSESGKRGGLSRSERGALKALFWATDGPNWKTTWDIENDYSDPCHDRVSKEEKFLARM
jgi:hypothetical protein